MLVNNDNEIIMNVMLWIEDGTYELKMHPLIIMLYERLYVIDVMVGFTCYDACNEYDVLWKVMHYEWPQWKYEIWIHATWKESNDDTWCMMTWNGTKGASLTMRNSGPIYAKHKLNASEW